MSTTPPRKLSTAKTSPHYNKEMLSKVHAVSVDGVPYPKCVAYDMDAGWAKFVTPAGSWGPKKEGHITVIMKDDPNLKRLSNKGLDYVPPR